MISTPKKALFVVHLPPISTSQDVAEKTSFSARCVPGHAGAGKPPQVEE